MMKKKLEDMHLQERINYGYRKVIIMMLVSGLFSIIVIGVLFANMFNYAENVSAADKAVKMCRINVNAAARNIREMALDDNWHRRDQERNVFLFSEDNNPSSGTFWVGRNDPAPGPVNWRSLPLVGRLFFRLLSFP